MAPICFRLIPTLHKFYGYVISKIISSTITKTDNYNNYDNIPNIFYSNEIIDILSHDFCIDTNFFIETQQKRFITKKKLHQNLITYLMCN